MAKEFKTMKVFDVTEMPKDIKELIYEKFSGRSNGWHISFYVYDLQYPENEHPEGGEIIHRDKDCGYVTKKGVDLISDWLHANGAKIHEKVLIKYWW
jgi:hypothetical protein